MSRRRHYATALLVGLFVLLVSPLAFAGAEETAADNIWGVALGAGLGIGIAASDVSHEPAAILSGKSRKHLLEALHRSSAFIAAI